MAYSAVPLTGAQWLTRLGPTARLSPTTIEVRGQIIGNQFRAVFSFDPRAYTMDVIRSLREGCLAAIESLIEEPSSVEAPLPKIPGSKLDRSELERRVMAGAQAARRHNDR